MATKQAAKKKGAAAKPDVRILILQRGWVFVGKYKKVGTEVTLSDARCVRKWGTTRGLGEIALGGPTTNTILDDGGTVRCHELVVVGSLDCVAEKWVVLDTPQGA
jgi:hypothetical protein